MNRILFSIRDCGLMIEPQQGMSVEDILGWAKYAEDSGYGYFFRSDHILPIRSPSRSGIASPECWVSLGALAARTSKIKFGPMVSPVGFRNPALLGRMACTLHSFSKGRLLMSLGAGWFKEEYLAHGFEFPPFSVREKQLIEAFEIIRKMTIGKKVDFEGEYFQAHVNCFPHPYGGKMHLIGGGRSSKVVRALAKYVDEWNIFGSTLETFSKLKQELESSRGEKAAVQISEMSSFIIADSSSGLRSKKGAYMRSLGLSGDASERIVERGIFCGTPNEFVSQVNERRKAGISKFYFQIIDTRDREMVRLLTSTLKKEF